MISSQNLPKISIITPVLNAGALLKNFLESVRDQDFPQEKIEIVAPDGGSSDNTVEIAKSFGAKIYENKLKTAESGKAVGIKNATGEFLVLLDSDNVLPQKDWLRKVIMPLIQDDSLVGAEPLYYTYRKEDGFIDRYCALMGMNDPIMYWFGNYDRMNVLSGKWTELDVASVKKNGYLEVTLESGNIPTIGANGTVLRADIFSKNPGLYGDYFFDVDALERLARKEGMVKFAKVDIGIVHLYCGRNLKRFAKKQLRRVKDFLFRTGAVNALLGKESEDRKHNYGGPKSLNVFIPVFKFVLSCVLVVPLVFQAVRGYLKKPDTAWFAHPLLCWVTLIVYARGTIGSFFKPEELSRENW